MHTLTYLIIIKVNLSTLLWDIIRGYSILYPVGTSGKSVKQGSITARLRGLDPQKGGSAIMTMDSDRSQRPHRVNGCLV